MSKPIAGSVIVITGASSGIGRAAALAFARAGATVVVAARREAALRRLAQDCESLGGRALACGVDVTDEQAVLNLARRAYETFGTIDVWINNAAVTLFGRFEQIPPDAYRRVIDTNLFGYVHGARAALPYFRESGRGILVNVSSGVGKMAAPFISAYVASKFAVIGLSQSLRMELRDAPGIHVCTVLPAAIDTPLYQHGANFMGWAAQPMPPVYSAEEVADGLVELVRCPRREMIIGSSAKWGLMMHAVAPDFTERIFARQFERNHFTDRAAALSAGNLFNPMEQYETADGGWRKDRERRAGYARTWLGAALVGAGLSFLIARRCAARGRSS